MACHLHSGHGEFRWEYLVKCNSFQLNYALQKNYPRYGLYLVGSSISYFGSKCSDMDICMLACTNPNIDSRMEAVYHLHVMKELLGRTNMFQDFNLIEARVPILRFTDRCHKVEVDINFNNSVGIRNTHLLYCYSQLDWRVRPMALTVKQWAQYHNINNAKNMTISSYSLMLMVIHFLQVGASPPVLPCLHNLYPEKFGLLQPNDFGYVDMNEVMAPYQSDNSQTLGDLLLSFLHYYSVFDYGKYAISIRVGGVLPIEVCRAATAPKTIYTSGTSCASKSHSIRRIQLDRCMIRIHLNASKPSLWPATGDWIRRGISVPYSRTTMDPQYWCSSHRWTQRSNSTRVNTTVCYRIEAPRDPTAQYHRRVLQY